jgi:hypothetical protein
MPSGKYTNRNNMVKEKEKKTEINIPIGNCHPSHSCFKPAPSQSIKLTD